MIEVHNVNVVFRCPASLKERMVRLAEAQDLRLSRFIRNACVEALQRSSEGVSQ